MKACFLDFEFRGQSKPHLDLVSVAAHCTEGSAVTYERQFWLHRGLHAKAAKAFFRHLLDTGYVFVAYVAEAEARSLMSLFQDDKKALSRLRMIDLYLEYRCLLNHNHSLSYGLQYIQGRKLKTTPPPSKWELMGKEEEDDNDAHHKPSYSLAAACYKLLKVEIDTEEKNKVRDIIIKGTPEEVEKNAERIMAYNLSDIKYLPKLLQKIAGYHTKEKLLLMTDWTKAALSRGDYAIRTAMMTELGYPVNEEKLKHFTSNVRKILRSAAEECLEVAPEIKSFKYDKKQSRYTVCEKEIRAFIEACGIPRWRTTKGGKLSISKDAFRDYFDSQSPGFAGAFCRYLKTKQSLNGFLPGGGKKGVFSDFLGPDGRVRPYFGIYSSQSSRSQPGATGFIPLKAHWMRNFIEPKPGRALAGIDYASQEFLIAATLSQDLLMMDAYRTGDVYLAFAKTAGLVPLSATKSSHKRMRDICKALVLGISYDMSAAGLAPRLTQAAGEPYTEVQAEELIATFYNTYSSYKEWKDETLNDYRDTGRLELPDGWIMWGDNKNYRSVGNFPVQGHGAVIMRDAVRRAQDAGLDVIFTLHDALYIEYKAYDVAAIRTLMCCMQDAFQSVMMQYGNVLPIRLEGESWCKEYGESLPDYIDSVVYLSEYIDEKGKSDLERYRQFLTSQTATKDEHHGIQESVRSQAVLQVQRVHQGSEVSL